MSLDCTRTSSKRKLDDYGPTDDEHDLVLPVRMRKDENESIGDVNFAQTTILDPPPHHHHQQQQPPSSSQWAPSPTRSHHITPPPNELQFFVRTMPCSSTGHHRTLVIKANSDRTIASVHEIICGITKIPVEEQRLIYEGKQLQTEQTLAECSVQNDAGLILLARMRSTLYPKACRLVDELIMFILRLCKGAEEKDSQTVPPQLLSDKVNEFLRHTTGITVITDPKKEKNKNSKLIADGRIAGYLQVFTTSRAPSALVMLYMSPYKGNKQRGDDSIRRVVGWGMSEVEKSLRFLCVPIVLEFCKLMDSSRGDPLYCFCRSNLASMMDCIRVTNESSKRSVCRDSGKALVSFQDIYVFVEDIMARLCTDLGTRAGPSSSDVGDLTAFLSPLCTAIMEHRGLVGSISLPMREFDYKLSSYAMEIKSLQVMFDALVRRLDQCLEKLEKSLAEKEKGVVELLPPGCAQYLTIFKDMNNLSRLYCGAQDKLVRILNCRKVAVRHLIIKYATRSDDHRWLLDHKGVMDFECRRHFAMMMLPEAKEDYEELHEMLIDRSQLLAESFEYFSHAGPEMLRAGLFMEFKNEEATGPGVLREWFCLVCQAIFNPQNALFLACPNDRRRFFPNPASKVDPLHLKYFKFAGRVIALALLHKVQVGIVFDRVFFLQLAGKTVSLEDIHDADPCLYSSCKKVLEMDAEMVDSDALGLTFVLDVEELGSRRIVELCPGGKNIVVNSRNREAYVKYLIEHRFVTSTTEQVAWFAQGFSDILSDSKLMRCFFRSLELEDLDWMLHGTENAISVEDWKAHTEYKGYKETDPQILWFWKIVGQMSADQRKVLLFFWTSVKYLPVEGFGGLASQLYIHKASESSNRLPSSHTCFYQLCFAPYPSMAVMEDRFRIITQEHIGSSFGTW